MCRVLFCLSVASCSVPAANRTADLVHEVSMPGSGHKVGRRAQRANAAERGSQDAMIPLLDLRALLGNGRGACTRGHFMADLVRKHAINVTARLCWSAGPADVCAHVACRRPCAACICALQRRGLSALTPVQTAGCNPVQASSCA